MDTSLIVSEFTGDGQAATEQPPMKLPIEDVRLMARSGQANEDGGADGLGSHTGEVEGCLSGCGTLPRGANNYGNLTLQIARDADVAEARRLRAALSMRPTRRSINTARDDDFYEH